MKIILQQAVNKLGAPGDVVEVADGYARNFLIPKKLAIAATRGGVKHAEQMRTAHQARVGKAVTEAQALADRLTTGPVRLGARAGEDGRLFGSITAAAVAEELTRRAGEPIDRKRLNLTEPIRSIGTHEVVVHLHAEVNPVITVEVVSQ